MSAKEVDGESIEDEVARLDDEVARRLLVNAAGQHEDVGRAVRLAAAGESERLSVLKTAVDQSLRTRRHLDYRGSMAWAQDAEPVMNALGDEVGTAPSAELVLLLQRAAGHLVKVILRADDSSGLIGDLCRQVLDLHRRACASGVADPAKLAKWMVRFTFEDQDFFEIDPARAVLAEHDATGYIDALLGDDEVDQAWAVATGDDREIPASQWLRLAKAREPNAPGDAMAVYLDLADAVLVRADKRAYREAIRHLKAARRAAAAADLDDEFTEHLVALREHNRRRPSFMTMLDKAGLAVGLS